mmetsp:Transcript_35894/g.35514  ORF Transcript_35894/g.35514 Transcript_35894/m.35514 type:complete len:95 (+) Transcript_35894:86-370(+)
MFKMLKHSNLKIPISNWKNSQQISREDLEKSLEDQEFIKKLKPFNLSEYFKEYESLIDLQANDIGNMAKICKALEEKYKIIDELNDYTDSQKFN